MALPPKLPLTPEPRKNKLDSQLERPANNATAATPEKGGRVIKTPNKDVVRPTTELPGAAGSTLPEARKDLTMMAGIQSFIPKILRTSDQNRANEAASAQRQLQKAALARADKIAHARKKAAVSAESTRLEGAYKQQLTAAGGRLPAADAGTSAAYFMRGLYIHQTTTATAYMTKSLALNYQQVFALRDIATAVTASAQALQSKLEAIKMNTAAPEVAKQSAIDHVRQELRRKALSGTVDSIYTTARGITDPIIKRAVKDPLKRAGSAILGSNNIVGRTARSIGSRINAARPAQGSGIGGEQTTADTTNALVTALDTYLREKGVHDKVSELRTTAQGHLGRAAEAVSERLDPIKKKMSDGKFDPKSVASTFTGIFAELPKMMPDSLSWSTSIFAYTQHANGRFGKIYQVVLTPLSPMLREVMDADKKAAFQRLYRKASAKTKATKTFSRKNVLGSYTKDAYKLVFGEKRKGAQQYCIVGGIPEAMSAKAHTFVQTIATTVGGLVERMSNAANDTLAPMAGEGADTSSLRSTVSAVGNRVKRDGVKATLADSDIAKQMGSLTSLDSIIDAMEKSAVGGFATDLIGDVRKHGLKNTTSMMWSARPEALTKSGLGTVAANAYANLPISATTRDRLGNVAMIGADMAHQAPGALRDLYGTAAMAVPDYLRTAHDKSRDLYGTARMDIEDRAHTAGNWIRDKAGAAREQHAERLEHIKDQASALREALADFLPKRKSSDTSGIGGVSGSAGEISEQTKMLDEWRAEQRGQMESLVAVMTAIAENTEPGIVSRMGRKVLSGAWLAAKFPFKASWWAYKKSAAGMWGGAKAVGGFLFRGRRGKDIVDLFRKGQKDPVVTAKQIRAGLVFDDGSPVESSYDIDRPVFDAKTHEMVVTQEDIDVGLVDPRGKPLKKGPGSQSIAGALTGGLFGTAGGIGKGIGKAIGGFFSPKNPIFAMYGTMFRTMGGLASSVVGALGKGAAAVFNPKNVQNIGKGIGFLAKPLIGAYASVFKVGAKIAGGVVDIGAGLVKKLFGIGGGSSTATRKDLDEIVGQRLDDIYEILKLNGRGGAAGDADGDGIRDGSYQDQLKKLGEKRSARQADLAARANKSLVGLGRRGMAAGLGGLAGLAAMAGIGGKRRDDDDESDDDGIVDNAAGYAAGAAATSLAGKAWGMIKGGGKRAAKFMGGRFGKIGKIAAAGIGGVAGLSALSSTASAAAPAAAAPTAAKAAAKTVSKTGLKMGATLLAKSAVKSVIKKIPLVGALAGLGFAIPRLMDGDFVGAGAEALSGLVSIIPIAGTGVSLAIDAWLGYRDYKNMYKDKPVGENIRLRMKAYGIDDEDQYSKVQKLEEIVDGIMTKGESKLKESEFATIAKKYFDLSGEEEPVRKFFMEWFKNRFMPIFTIEQQLIGAQGFTFDQIYDIPDEQMVKINESFKKASAPIAIKYAELKPTAEQFAKMMKDDAEKKKKAEEAKGGTTAAATISDALKQNEDANKRDVLAEQSATDANKLRAAAKAAAAERERKQKESLSMWDKIDETAKVDPNASWWSRLKQSSAAAAKNTAVALGLARPIDEAIKAGGAGMSNVPSAPSGEGLGGLSAHYESGKRGSAAIGYDSTGGTSYGKYQISSTTMPSFLAWLLNKGGPAAEIAKRLKTAGPINTGSKVGAFPSEWQKIVSEGLMGDLEHEFIKASHYDVAFNKLTPELQTTISKSPALQDVLWSTAVQHGPGGAARIFTRTYDPTLGMEGWIKAIYTARGGNFGSSTPAVQASVRNRFIDEQTRAIAALASDEAKLAAQKSDTAAPVATAATSPEAPANKAPSAATPAAGPSPAAPTATAGMGDSRIPTAPSPASMSGVDTITPPTLATAAGDKASSDPVKFDPKLTPKQNSAAMETDQLARALKESLAPLSQEMRQANSNLQALHTTTESGNKSLEQMATKPATPPNTTVVSPVFNGAQQAANQAGSALEVSVRKQFFS